MKAILLMIVFVIVTFPNYILSGEYTNEPKRNQGPPLVVAPPRDVEKEVRINTEDPDRVRSSDSELYQVEPEIFRVKKSEPHKRDPEESSK